MISPSSWPPGSTISHDRAMGQRVLLKDGHDSVVAI
jgi:hypothetical protein